MLNVKWRNYQNPETTQKSNEKLEKEIKFELNKLNESNYQNI